MSNLMARRGTTPRLRSDYCHRIADAHAPRPHDLAPDAERQPLGRRNQSAVRLQDLERLEIRRPRLRVLRRDCAPADVAVRPHDRLAEPHLAPEPRVLLVLAGAV